MSCTILTYPGESIPELLNAHLVEHVPDGCAGLVDRGHNGVAHACKARHVLHDIECGKGVQTSCWLVQEQQGRLSYQRTCYAQLPLFPACISTTSLGNATPLHDSVVTCSYRLRDNRSKAEQD